jgi:hypothetical protein
MDRRAAPERQEAGEILLRRKLRLLPHVRILPQAVLTFPEARRNGRASRCKGDDSQ